MQVYKLKRNSVGVFLMRISRHSTLALSFQARAQQETTSAAEPVDPTLFIQTLPSTLRQSVLAEMDDSLIAVLPADLAAEAQEHRETLRRRQGRYMQDRLLSGRHPLNRLNMSSGFRLPTGTVWGDLREARGKQNNAPPVKVQVRQLLSHDSLACLLLLLFVGEPKLNLSRLHRVLRNICFHAPTRHWLVGTLVAILQHSRETRDQDSVADDAMDYRTTPLVKQKPGAKVKTRPATALSDARNLSWLSIKLDAALGSRTGIFRVAAPGRGGAKKKRGDCRVCVHPQAAPVVCRHVVDTLHMLAKFFPQHFVGQRLGPSSGAGAERRVETDFWEILLRLESLSFSSELPKKSECFLFCSWRF